MIQNTDQIKITPASNFVVMLKKVFLFFLQKPFIDRPCLRFQSFPDRSRKNVTNEIFQELRNIASTLINHLDHSVTLIF